MGLLQRVRQFFAGLVQTGTLRHQRDQALERVSRMMSKIDAASTSEENRKHWANADNLGPNAALDDDTRTKLRSRGRYEAINNSYARGLVRTSAVDLIGIGPRVQLSIPGAPSATTKQIERWFSKWSRCAKLGMKYRLMEKGSFRDGGMFALLDTNPRLRDYVKLDLRLLEDDFCATPLPLWAETDVSGGIKFDRFGDPVEYYFLKEHPGEMGIVNFTSLSDFQAIPSERVLHWYEKDRAGQMRGVPKLTSSLPLFAQLRRYTLATLTAAEFAAMLAGVMKTTLPPTTGEPVALDQWELIEMVRGALMSLPQGWEAMQFKPEQPATTYPEFKREILNEAGRGSGAPLNIVTGNSSGYNFSSGRLDHLPYQRGLMVDRDDFRTLCADRVFEAYNLEAVMAEQYRDFYAALPPIEEWTWSWNWDAFDSIDQVKDAQADDIRLKNGTLTYKEVYAAYGQDSEEQLEQVAAEVKFFRDNGLMHPMDAEAAAMAGPVEEETDTPESEAATNRINGHSLSGRSN